MNEKLTMIGLRQVRSKHTIWKEAKNWAIGTFSKVFMIISLESDSSFKKIFEILINIPPLLKF